MNVDLLPAFALATLVFAAMPGPALIYTAAQTLARGRGAGFAAVLGVHLGGWVHVAAAALGLSAIFRHAPELYATLKLAGAGYLIWLGLRMVLAPASASGAAGPHGGGRSARRAFLDSVLVETLNPKTALFFLAFLPQFVDQAAARPTALQFLLLGAAVNLAFSAADIVAVLTASAVMRRAAGSARLTGLARKLGGTALMALGARLALARDE